MAVGDLNGDGRLDAFLARLELPLGPGPAAVWLGGPRGRLLETVPSPVTGGITSTALGDLDGDGDLDVLAQTVVLLNDGAGSLAVEPGALPPGTGDGALALDDLDGDGDLDVYVGGSSEPDQLLLNDSTGHFVNASANLPPRADGSVGVRLGDIDGDGQVDALLLGGDPELLLNVGGATFVDATQRLGSPASLPRIQRFALGDVDGDGDLDAARRAAALAE